MKVRIVTALFDIKRDLLGDGRKIEDYLNWFENTLKLKCDMTIYTENRFKEFVLDKRKDSEYKTELIIQNLTEIPYYHKKELIHDIINSHLYKKKMADISRIECYLTEYNLIQFSKFGWLKMTKDRNTDVDFLFWMDAGCSRFFSDFDMNSEWPNKNLVNTNIILQGNSNFLKNFRNMNIEEYMWDNNSMIAGTLFGGKRESIEFLYTEIIRILEYCESNGCVNNDQIALTIFVKKFESKCDLFLHIDGTHLPLFKFLGKK